MSTRYIYLISGSLAALAEASGLLLDMLERTLRFNDAFHRHTHPTFKMFVKMMHAVHG
jgi:hypothetical protein